MSTSKIDKILVATDGGDSSQHAVALGVELAAAEGAEVTFLHVVPPIDFVAGRMSLPAVPRRLRHVGDEALDEAAHAADSRGVRFERDLIAGETPATIVALADTIDADLVVVGEHPSRRIRLRSGIARWVARHSRRTVLVARPPVGDRVAAQPVGAVLVALQGDPRDDVSIDEEAVSLALRLQSELVAVRIVPLTDPRVPRNLGPLSYLGPHRLQPVDARLDYAVQAGRWAGLTVEAELVAASDQAKAIAQAAERHDASVVLVEAPGTGLAARLRGRRLARRVRRLSHVPVFTARAEPAGRSS